MSQHLSPLRYPGGKSILSKFLLRTIEQNGWCDGTYVEPFAGGAGAALSLLYSECVQEIILNDIDQNIYAFWNGAINDTEEFIKYITDTPVSIEERERQKLVLKHRDDYSITQQGFATFYLNRCNFSGILHGGPIGGINQSGKWKLDARFNKIELIKRIKLLSFYKSRIKIYNLDVITFVKKILLPSIAEYKKLLVYFDPPYYKNGKNLYLNYYTEKSHKTLSNFLKSIKIFPWILTYDNVFEIRNLYQSFIRQEFTLNYSANQNKIGNELLITSNNFSVPSLLV